MARRKRRSLTIQGYQVTPSRGGWRVEGKELKFSLLEIRTGTFRLSCESSTGRIRKQFEADSIEAAVSEATVLLAGTEKTAKGLSTATVIRRWMQTLSCGPGTRKDYNGATKRFIRWLGRRHEWAELRLEHLQTYAQGLRKAGKTPRTIALYVLPIRTASKWAAANWPEHFRDFAAGYRPPRIQVVPAVRDSFSLAELGEYLLWLRKQPDGWKILPGVALQGLCGLRVLEAVRLLWDRVDLDSRLLRIDGEVKNAWSVRMLPLPDLVVEILREAPKGERVVPTYSERTTYSAMVTTSLAKWSEGRKVEPRGLRRTLPSEAKLEGWDGFALERYLGHAPRDITERHYLSLSESQILGMLQEQVVGPVNSALQAYLAAWQGKEEKVIKAQFGT